MAARRGDLAALVANANATAGAIADENESLDQRSALLPGTLRKANTTFVNLRSTLDDLDELIAASKPATQDLAPFLRTCARSCARRARRCRPQPLIRTRGPDNDLIDLLRKTPALATAAGPTFAHTITALQVAAGHDFIRPYAPDLIGWLRDFGQGAANYDANGHYARIQPIFNAFSFSRQPGRRRADADPAAASAAPASQTTSPALPGRRQPAAPADGSAPFRDAVGTLRLRPARAARSMKRVAAIALVLARRRGARRLRHGRERRRRRLPGARDLRQRRLASSRART